MAKRLVRLTESDLHRIIKESVKRVLREAEGIDATEYIDNNTDKFLSTYGGDGYTDYPKSFHDAQKMPEGYDDDLGFDDYDTVERLASLNRPYGDGVYPGSKEIENMSSWDAIDDEYTPPIDDGSAENLNVYDTWK